MRTSNFVNFRNFISQAHRRRSLWGNHNDLTDFSSLSEEKRKLHSLSDSELKQIRQKKSFSCDSDVTGHGNRQRGTQRGEFYSLDKIFSTLCLCWCIHVAYESTFFSVMPHFPIYMGWTSRALNIKMDSDMPIGSRDPYPSTHVRERSGSVVECLTSLETEGPRIRASSVSLCCVFEQGTFILA